MTRSLMSRRDFFSGTVLTQLAALPIYRAIDVDGNPMRGAQLHFYRSGTTTPQSVYATPVLAMAHANPVQADAHGMFPAMHLDPAKRYRAILRTSAGAVVSDLDPVTNVSLAQIPFLQAGSGAIARTVQDKAREIVSALDFIPVAEHAAIRARTSTTDVVAYLQAAIDAVIAAGGGELIFPSGTYVVGDSLEIADPQHCNLRGAGKDLSIIVRNNPRGPIMRLTNGSGASQGNGYYWRWEGLQFRFSPPASASSTDAIGVSFENGTGDRAYGHVNFLWRDIQIASCHVAVTNDWGPGVPPNVWGWSWDSIVIADFAARALYLTNGGVGAFPNCHIASIYLQARSDVTYTAAPFYCDGVDGWTIDCLEWNNGTFSTDAIFSAVGARALAIGTMRLESIAFTTEAIQAVVFSQAAYTVIGNVSIGSCRMGAGVVAAVLRLGGTALGSIHSIQTAAVTGRGTMVSAIESAPGNLVYLGQTSPSEGRWLGGSAGYSDPRLEINADGARLRSSLQIGPDKVLGARDTGWTAATGSANKGAFATYPGQNFGATYAEAQAQATDDAAKANSQRIKAIEDALRRHGLID